MRTCKTKTCDRVLREGEKKHCAACASDRSHKRKKVSEIVCGVFVLLGVAIGAALKGGDKS